MRRTLKNRTVAASVAIFTPIGAVLLHRDPFGDGTIAWPVAIVVALAGNVFLAYVVTPWAAPYLASAGGREGAAKAAPHSVAVAERWTSGTLMVFGLLAIMALALSNAEVVVTPTERLEKNAALVKRTVEAEAPAQFKPMLGAADTWKMSERTLRTCVPPPDDKGDSWCVVVRSEADQLTIVKTGPGLSNAAQALEWHPELAEQNNR
ncbi:MAG: hypothetical protein ACPHCI_00380 [Solirubrobacterales bacterium]